jgi:tetrahydromethanopterin S-methyltransferase subunit G
VQHPYEPLISLEGKVAHLDGRVDQGFTDMRDRFNSIDQPVDGLEQRLDTKFSEFAQRLDVRLGRFETRLLHSEKQTGGWLRVDDNFLWLLGILIVSILLPFARAAAHFFQ